ncbi:hypothetical protein [Pectobacterium sp. LFLA-215]|uniref:hypothetical protein n=1 Tax=Pectobacterium sp. LFLA-215 TaxID=3419008 RepID=UPI003F5CA562
MISNDIILNSSSIAMLISLSLWGVCFFVFVYRNLGGPRLGKDSLLFFNFMFFKRNILSNFALLFLILGYMAAAIAEYRRDFNCLLLMSNLAGGISFFFFALYGKYFYQELVDDEKSFFFLKIFLTKLDLSFGATFLWLSRLAYITWLIVLIK